MNILDEPCRNGPVDTFPNHYAMITAQNYMQNVNFLHWNEFCQNYMNFPSIINNTLMKFLLTGNQNVVTHEKITKFIRYFGTDLDEITSILEQLYELGCYYGFIDSRKAKKLLKNKSQGTYLIRASQSREAKVLVASVVVDETIRKILETKGSPDSGEPIYEYLLVPERGYYNCCGCLIQLNQIPRLFTTIFKIPLHNREVHRTNLI